MIAEQPLELTVPDEATLEGWLAIPPGAAAGVIMCHPHPLHGGDMDNPIVLRTIEVCSDVGLATLRFNFRGVGRSTGQHGGGVAEERDLETAIITMTRRVDRVALAGYSFGAVVVAAVAAKLPEIAGVALIAPPLSLAGGTWSLFEEALRKVVGKSGIPALIVAGDADEYCPRRDLERLGGTLAGMDVRLVAGANHFFFGKLFPLGETIRQWASRLQTT